MKISFFTAKRLISAKQSGSSKVIVTIATAAVAVSVAVMIISVAVVKGYQQQIKHKVTGFASHIQLSRLDLNNSFETVAIGVDTTLEKKIKQIPEVEAIQPFIIKAGIVKTDEDFSGIVLKGIDKTYKKDFIQLHLLRGVVPTFMDIPVKSAVLVWLKPPMVLEEILDAFPVVVIVIAVEEPDPLFNMLLRTVVLPMVLSVTVTCCVVVAGTLIPLKMLADDEFSEMADMLLLVISLLAVAVFSVAMIPLKV